MQPDLPDLATALAKHMCELDACSDPAPCFDHLTVAGVALKFLGNVAPAPIVLSKLSVEATAELTERLRTAMRNGRITVLPPTEDERERAAYQRGLAAANAPLVAELRAFGIPTADSDPLDALRLLVARCRDLEQRVGATEGWEREWGVVGDDGWTYVARNEPTARDVALNSKGGTVVSRLVGPWETAEQLEPCCDLHGRNCEQGGEECCEHCTEAHHFEIGHGGVPCSSPDLSAVQPEDSGR